QRHAADPALHHELHADGARRHGPAHRRRRLLAHVPRRRLVGRAGRDWAMGPAFEVAFAVENFTLDAAAMGGANSRHVGHAALSIDGLLLAETAAGVHAVSGLLPGAHTLRLELVNNDGTPLEPPVYTTFPFTVNSAVNPM
ncbi:MAG: hypothetical protein Q7U06_02085, partial [Pseudomonadota bacterium]|nr:hypothetical protein [Pseudomonadota bacterium]